jgi:hypothetical protein
LTWKSLKYILKLNDLSKYYEKIIKSLNSFKVV